MSGAPSQMTQRCSFERDSTAGRSDTKNFVASPAGTVACRLWASAGKEAVGAEKVTVVEDLRAIVPLGTDVTVLDQIHGVVDRLGAVIDARPLEVQTVLARRDHLELVLEVIGAPSGY